MKNKLQQKLDELLTMKEIHEVTGIPLRTIRYWIEQNRLPVYKFRNGAKYGIRLIDVPKYLRLPKKLLIKKGLDNK